MMMMMMIIMLVIWSEWSMMYEKKTKQKNQQLANIWTWKFVGKFKLATNCIQLCFVRIRMLKKCYFFVVLLHLCLVGNSETKKTCVYLFVYLFWKFKSKKKNFVSALNITSKHTHRKKQDDDEFNSKDCWQRTCVWISDV